MRSWMVVGVVVLAAGALSVPMGMADGPNPIGSGCVVVQLPNVYIQPEQCLQQQCDTNWDPGCLQGTHDYESVDHNNLDTGDCALLASQPTHTYKVTVATHKCIVYWGHPDGPFPTLWTLSPDLQLLTGVAT